MSRYVKGFVVGQAPPWFDVDGARTSRPKLVEVEVFEKTVQLMIGNECVLLDAEALECLVGALSSVEVVA